MKATPFIAAVVVYCLFVSLAAPMTIFGASTFHYTISLNRSAIPSVNYNAVTLNTNVGSVTGITLIEDGSESLPYTYEATTGKLSFTTDGNSVVMTLTGPDANVFGGQLTIAPLKDGKAFAWSHSMDDNVFLENSIAVFDSYNYRGTIYAIGQHISDTRDENWILDKINFHQLLGKGWAIGNHTYNHGCYGVDYAAEIMAGYNRIIQIIPDSPKPNYVINSFAAPCFDSNYHPFILQHRNNGTTPTLMNESGNDELLIVDPSAMNYTNNGRTAKAFHFDLAIGRGNAIELGNTNQAIATVNWMAAQANANRHFWYNTFSHDSKEASLATVMAYIHANYGAAGDQSIWVAPAEEIYAYLLVREWITLTVTGSSEGGNTATPTATALPPTSTPVPLTPTPVPPTATPGSGSQSSYAIYDDALTAGWSMGKWGNITYQPTNSNPVQTGAASLALTYNEAWSTFYMNSAQPITAAAYDNLAFWVYGNPGGTSSLRVAVMNNSYVTSNKISLNNLAPGWQQVHIPLADFGSLTDIAYLLWENAYSTAQPAIYLDQVVFESTNSAPATNTPVNTSTNTPQPQATATNTPTSTPVQPVATNTPTQTPQLQATATNTPVNTLTSTPTNTPTAIPGSASGFTIYGDALTSGWSAGTWGSLTGNLNTSSPAQAGAASLSVQYNSAWGTYYLVSNQALSAADYANLSFWVYGHSGGTSSVSVAIMNSSYQTSYRAQLNNLAPGWQFVQIPLADLGPLTDILYILIDNPKTSSQPAIYFDEVVLEDVAGGGQVTASNFAYRIMTQSDAPAPVINGHLTRPLTDEPDLRIFLPFATQ